MLKPLRNNILITIIISLLICPSFTSFGQNVIDALKLESKETKLSVDLLDLLRSKSSNQTNAKLRQAAPSPAITENNETGLTKVDHRQIHDALIAIEAVANNNDGQGLLSQLKALGLQEGRYFKRIVFGHFPIEKLDELRNIQTLHIARPAYTAFRRVGKTTSQGDSVMRADVARKRYNLSGAGSKVGILSDSYNSLNGAAEGVASGDLPANVQVIAEIPSQYKGSDEGRAMAEIVHDVAPGADIAFATAYETQVDFANGILGLAEAGCNIIVDDIIYLSEPFFQDGILAQVANFVVKNLNISYFSSAGNNAEQSFQSGFRNSGKPAPTLDLSWGHAHDFGNGVTLQKVVIPAGGEFFPIFQWNDPFYSQGAVDLNRGVIDAGIVGAKTDMDILVYYQGRLQLGLSSISGNIGDDPIEAIDLVNNGQTPIEIEVAYIKYDGPDPSLMKWVDFGYGSVVQYATNSSTTYGHANAEKAIAVGAAPWYRTPAFNPTAYPIPLIESFSSKGGTPILYTEYGQPIPSITRLKPEITAPDGGNTTFFGQLLNDGDNFPNFFGTSAAAPHAAAVAALLQEKAQNSMSPTDILLRLRTTAIDMDDPSTPGFDTGFDFRTGFGFIQADKALMIDGEPLVILEPIYNCTTGQITLRTQGGDGTPITFTAPGVTRSSPTSTTGIVEQGLRNDPKNIVIWADQSGYRAAYDFNFSAYCNNLNSQSRLATTEPGLGLQVLTLGNPVSTDWIDVEVRGIEGKSLKLEINNTLGALTNIRSIEAAGTVERHKLRIGQTPGLYFLKVSTSDQTKTIKVIRQ